MDKLGLEKAVLEGAASVGEALAPEQAGKLVRYLEELLRWNQKVNLTAVRDPMEAVELHLVDSLAVLREIRGARQVLDLGAGGGLPGIPLKIALPEIQLVMVDAVAKKVGFLKAAIAVLGLTGAKAIHGRAGGKPQAEGFGPCDLVIARAFMDLEDWCELGRHYVTPGGRLVAMLGKAPGDLEPVAERYGFGRVALRGYRLPRSGAERNVATFWKGG